MFDPELDSFKTNIDIRCYAVGYGYKEDRHDSSRASTCMRHQATKDKVFFKRDSDGHWVYFSVRDDRDNGTIIDWIKRRRGYSLGEIRKELRPWLGMPADALPSFPPLEKVTKDRIQVERAFARMRVARAHPYLENERMIPRELLASPRFDGRIRIDSRHGNAIFPHAEGLSGYEIKNHQYTSFAPAGTKSLWMSHERGDDQRLVIAESAIDALSYATLFPNPADRFASVGGKMTPKQHELVRSAASTMPQAAIIVSAGDNDAGGSEMAGIIAEAVRLTGRSDLRFERHSPKDLKDWNLVLQKRPPQPLPRWTEELRAG
jgi:hypothetical protein